MANATSFFRCHPASPWATVSACILIVACRGAPPANPIPTVAVDPTLPASPATTPPDAGTAVAPTANPTDTDDPSAASPIALLPAGVTPEGVADLLGGALPYIPDPCRRLAEAQGAAAPGTPLVVPRPIEIGTSGPICLFGYPAGRAVPVTVYAPDDTVYNLAVEIVDDALSGTTAGSRRWTAFPGDPVGAYTLSASGPDGLRTTVILEITPATAPHVIADPAEVPAGGELRVGVAGFPPGQALPIHVYARQPAGTAQRPWRYLTTLGPLTPDASGAAGVRVDVPQGAATTDYALVPGASVADYRTIAVSDFRVVP